MSALLNMTLVLLKQVGDEQNNPVLSDATAQTKLFGHAIDSMGMVFLIADLEALISEQYGVNIVLADERAMSQKTSPFRTVDSLVKYMTMLIDDAKAGL